MTTPMSLQQSFHLNTTMVAIFPNACLWRHSLYSNLVLTLKTNCIKPSSYASTAYVVVIRPSSLSDSFVKIWATCEIFLGKWFTAPPGKTFPERLCIYTLRLWCTATKPSEIKTLTTLGDRYFAAAAPQLWNSWPYAIRGSLSVPQ